MSPALAKRIVRRFVVSFGIASAALVGSVLLLTAAVLFVGPISRYAITTGLIAYNTEIPGRITVGEITGSLGAALRLRQVAAADRLGKPIAGADEISLRWSPLHLLAGELRVPVLQLEGPFLNLSDADGPTRFRDLAPAGPQAEGAAAPAAPLMGPRIPLDVHATLIVDGFDLGFYAEDRGPSHIFQAGRLSAAVEGIGRSFEAQISRLETNFPVPDIRIRKARLRLTWNGRALNGSSIEADTSLGQIVSSETGIDFATGEAYGTLQVTGDISYLERLTGLSFAVAPMASLQGSGGLNHAKVTAEVTLDDRTSTSIEATGALSPTPEIRTRFTVRSTAPGAYLGLSDGNAVGRGQARLKVQEGGGITLTGRVRCDACRLPPLGAIRLNGEMRLQNKTADLTASLETAALRAEASASIVEGLPARGDWTLAVERLSAFNPLLSRYVDLPPVRGRIESNGRCDRRRKSLFCNGEVSIEKLALSKVRVRRGRSTFSLQPLSRKTPFDGDLTLRDTSVWGVLLKRATLSASGNTDRVGASLDAIGTERSRIQTRFRAARTPDATVVSVERLKGQLRGVRADLAGPAEVTLRKSSVHLAPFSLRLGDGRLRARGEIPLNPSRPGALLLHLRRLDLGSLSRLLPGGPPRGVIDLDVSLSGTFSRPEGSVRGSAADLAYGDRSFGSGTLAIRYRDDRLTGKIDAEEGPFRLAAFSANLPLPLGPGHPQPHSIHGSRGGMLFVDNLSLSFLAAYLPKVRMTGTADLLARVSGTGAVLQVCSSPVTLLDLPLGAVTLTAAMEDGRAFGALDILADGQRLVHFDASAPLFLDDRARPTWRNAAPIAAHVELPPTAVEKLRVFTSLFASIPADVPLPNRGKLGLRLRAFGTGERPVVSGGLTLRGATLNGVPLEDASIDVHYSDSRLGFAARLTGAGADEAVLLAEIPLSLRLHPWRVRRRAGSPHRVRLVLSNVDRAFIEPFYTLPSGSDFSLNATFDAEGTARRFELDGAWDGLVQPGRRGPIAVNGTVHADPEKQKLTVHSTRAGTSLLSLSLTTKATLTAIAEGTFDPMATRVDGTLKIPRLPLEVVGDLMPSGYDGLTGHIEGRARATGTFQSPRIQGALQLSGGSITVVPIGGRLEDITARLALKGHHLEIETLRFRSGRGEADGSGSLDFVSLDRIDGAFMLRLSGFPVIRPGLPEAVLNARLDLKLHRLNRDITADLAMEKADLQLLSREGSDAPDPIEQSRHIILVDKNRQPRRSEQEKTGTYGKGGQLRFDLRIPDVLRVHGAGVEMNWDGALHMTWKNDSFYIDGALRTDHGYFQLLGNSMWIEKGEITLPQKGDPDPILFFLAHTSTPDADVTLSLKGRLSRPRLELTSTPPLGQYEIMSLLATGKAYTGNDNQAVRSEVASMLLAVRNPLLQSELDRRLRLDYLSASIGDSINDPVLIAGKRINRNIYVQTQIAPNAKDGENRVTGRVAYHISPRWTVETYYGDANQGGLGFYWSKRFGLPETDKGDASEAAPAPEK